MSAAPAPNRLARDRAAEGTRSRILAAVETLLAKGGEDAVSIREVCLRAGVTAPTIYHHFGDKQALVDRVIDECFAEFDRSLRRRRLPSDPVEALRAGFDNYVAYGLKHPSHYRLIFQNPPARPTAAGLASYEGLRAAVGRIDQAKRLRTTVDEGAFAFWVTAHGLTSLLINGFHPPGESVALVRDSLIERLTLPAAAGRKAKFQPSEVPHAARK